MPASRKTGSSRPEGHADLAPLYPACAVPSDAPDPGGYDRIRIVEKVGQKPGLRAVDWLGTLSLHGNISAATMSLALSWYLAMGRSLKAGPVLRSAFGAGLIWGAVVWQP
jgi:3-Oxoacyl-[acyl-carrier-protein (ACP)] synthase III C terminal